MLVIYQNPFFTKKFDLGICAMGIAIYFPIRAHDAMTWNFWNLRICTTDTTDHTGSGAEFFCQDFVGGYASTRNLFHEGITGESERRGGEHGVIYDKEALFGLR